MTNEIKPIVNLESWLLTPAFQKFVGRSVAMKLEIFSAVLADGGNIAAIAARHGVTKQAGHQMANRARKIISQLPS